MAGTRAQSGDWYGSDTLHPGQVLRGSLPLLCPLEVQYAEEITGNRQCGCRSNRSNSDHIFCIRQILEKIWEYNEAVHQLFIDLKKVYGSVGREVLYNILIEVGVPKKLVRLIKMCLTETYDRVCIDKNFPGIFPVRNGLKKGDDLLQSLFNLF